MPEPAPVLLITRPEPAGAMFALSVIEALGRPVQTLLSPLIGIVPLPVTAPDPLPAGVVLTSVHGAEAAGRMGLPADFPAWCVGARTAEAARAAGLAAINADGDAQSLTAMILAGGTEGPLLHLRGEHVTGDIAQTLSDAGVPCTDLVCYRQNPLPLTSRAVAALSGDRPVALPLFSPRTVFILAESAPFAANLTVIAISQAVAAAAAALRPTTVLIADRPDAEAMCEATCRAVAANSIPTGP